MNKNKNILFSLFIGLILMMLTGCDKLETSSKVQQFINQNLEFRVEAISGAKESENLYIKNNSEYYINGLDFSILDKVSHKEIDSVGSIYMRPNTEVKLIINTTQPLRKLKFNSSSDYLDLYTSKTPDENCVYASDLSINFEDLTGQFGSDITACYYQKAQLINHTDKPITLNPKFVFTGAVDGDNSSLNITKFDPTIVFGDQPIDIKKMFKNYNITIQPGSNQIFVENDKQFKDASMEFLGQKIETYYYDAQEFINNNITTRVEPIANTTSYETIMIKNNSNQYVNGVSVFLLDNKTQTLIDTSSFQKLYLKPGEEVGVIAKTQAHVSDIKIMAETNITGGDLTDSPDEDVLYPSDFSFSAEGGQVAYGNIGGVYQKINVTNHTNKMVEGDQIYFRYYGDVQDAKTGQVNYEEIIATTVPGDNAEDYSYDNKVETYLPGNNLIAIQCSSGKNFTNLKVAFYGRTISSY